MFGTRNASKFYSPVFPTPVILLETKKLLLWAPIIYTYNELQARIIVLKQIHSDKDAESRKIEAQKLIL
jgi:hypothetical protein